MCINKLTANQSLNQTPNPISYIPISAHVWTQSSCVKGNLHQQKCLMLCTRQQPTTFIITKNININMSTATTVYQIWIKKAASGADLAVWFTHWSFIQPHSQHAPDPRQNRSSTGNVPRAWHGALSLGSTLRTVSKLVSSPELDPRINNELDRLEAMYTSGTKS